MPEISLIIKISLGDDGIRQELDAEDDSTLGELIDFAKEEFHSTTGKEFAVKCNCKLGDALSQDILQYSYCYMI